MSKTTIEWCDRTWNPITGCPGPLVSPGCDNCFARRVAETRLRGRCGYDAVDPFKITYHPDRAYDPLGWKNPQRIFVGSMGDMFHIDVPCNELNSVFSIMAMCPQHTFMMLTKRPEVAINFMTAKREKRVDDSIPEDAVYDSVGRAGWWGVCPNWPWEWPLPNVWLGVTVCDNSELWKVEALCHIPAAKRFVCFEPLLGEVDASLYLARFRCAGCGFLSLSPVEGFICPECGETHADSKHFSPQIDWVICGGETGPNARPMHPAWARRLRDQCAASGVPFFFKGWGEYHWVGERNIQSAKNCTTAWPDCSIGDGTAEANGGLGTNLYRVGKAAAGRLLDGIEHNGIPV